VLTLAFISGGQDVASAPWRADFPRIPWHRHSPAVVLSSSSPRGGVPEDPPVDLPFKRKRSLFDEPEPLTLRWKQTVITQRMDGTILSYVIPVILRGLFYRILGARMGRGCCAGKIVEPQMVTIAIIPSR
jgi:hypothetical protein